MILACDPLAGGRCLLHPLRPTFATAALTLMTENSQSRSSVFQRSQHAAFARLSEPAIFEFFAHVGFRLFERAAAICFRFFRSPPVLQRLWRGYAAVVGGIIIVTVWTTDRGGSPVI